MSTLLVGHVTKDGSIAGPRVLEHLVDVVLQFEGERSGTLRMVRATKNRFGPVDEVGCFSLGPQGITAVSDPSGLFVGRFGQGADGVQPGTAVTVVMDGRRPLLAEVQGRVVLDDGDVAASAAAHLDAMDAASSVPGLGGMAAGVADDGATVTVRLDAEVDLLAAAGPFAGMLPLSVPIQATGDSRTSLSR